MYELNDKEFEAVSVLNADYREAHFLQKIKDAELFIVIDKEGPYIIEDEECDDNGQKNVILPVFCHERYANLFINNLKNKEDITDLKAQSISYKAWMDSWVKVLQTNGMLLGIMPIDEKDFNVLEPDFSKVAE